MAGNRRRNTEDPPHWYFPISRKEMQKRRMKNINKALKGMGLTKKDLKNININKIKKKRR